MKPTVHILCYVRKPELLEAALLVFKSIRTGFPTYRINVWGNQLAEKYQEVVRQAAYAVGANFANIARTSHDAWIESLILESLEPFWICDTDVVFWEDMEGRGPGVEGAAFAGRFEPEFEEPFTGCVHVERLQACCMYIDPALTRAAIRAFMASIPEHFRQTGEFPMIRQTYLPVRETGGGPSRKTILYDTMAGLYQAGFGRAFSEEENDCFDHLHCGSYSDLSGPALGATGRPSLQEQHRAVCRNPQLARGLRSFQKSVYERWAVKGKEQHAI